MHWLLFSCGAGASHCDGAEALGHAGFSRCGPRALEHRLIRCDTGAYLLLSMWDLPGSGIELVSPALTGTFFTTEPPGKPCISVLT